MGETGLDSMVMRPLTPRWFFVIATFVFAIVAAPAWADFESAVAAYEQGDYQKAYEEFSTLARDGDARAQPYLDRIHRKLQAGTETGNSSTSGSSNQSGSRQSRESGAQPSDWAIDITLWNPSEEHSAPRTANEIVVPYHASVWSTLLHMPADATVVGLQYVARLFNADRLYRDLQVISRNGDKLTLGMLAAVWWLMILRAIYGIGQIMARIMKMVFTSWEHETNG